MIQHIYQGTTNPNFIPPGTGHHYVNTTTKKIFFSVGTSSINDWISNDDSILIEDQIISGVTNKAPSQNSVYNALLATSMQNKTISSDLTISADNFLIRSRTKIASGVKLKILNGGILKLI